MSQPAFRPLDLQNLEESRGKFVLKYRANPKAWPDGIGAWFRNEDWDAEGKLVAAGEARARAVDPWANDRAKGLPCPSLPTLRQLNATINRDATINQRGRPVTGNAMSSTERSRQHRTRQAAKPKD